jgi:hypothetical protein
MFILDEGYDHTDFALDSLRCPWTSASSSGIIINDVIMIIYVAKTFEVTHVYILQYEISPSA